MHRYAEHEVTAAVKRDTPNKHVSSLFYFESRFILLKYAVELLSFTNLTAFPLLNTSYLSYATSVKQDDFPVLTRFV